MCAFCEYEPKNIILSTRLSFVVVNKFPLGEMSFLCLPKTHVTSITELSLGEKTDLLLLVTDVAEKLKKTMNPAGLNIFINEGLAAAGQTSGHLCVHVIARGWNDNLKNFELIGRPIPITEEEILSVKKTLLKRGP